MIALSELRELLDKATPGEWYIVGPPWNEGAPWINAGSEDPHRGLPVCDFTGDYQEWPSAEPNAALIVAAVNALPELLARVAAAEHVAEVAKRVATEREGHELGGESPLYVALCALDEVLAAWEESR